MADQSPREKAARKLIDSRRTLAKNMAMSMTPPANAKKVASKDERWLFWQRDPNADEAALWQDVQNAAVMNGMDVQEAYAMAWPSVRDTLYPERERVIQAAGRKLSVKEQVAFSKRMEALGPPEDENDDTGY